MPSESIDRSPNDTIQVNSYVRRRSSTPKKLLCAQKTNKSKATMDPATFRLILQKQSDDIISFKAEQKQNPQNAQHANSWALFRAKHPKHATACKSKKPKRRFRKILTVEQSKAIQAAQFQAEYIHAIHDLSNPMPAKFQNLSRYKK